MKVLAKRAVISLLALAILLTTSSLALSAETASWKRNEDGFYVNSKGEIIVGALRRGVDVSEWNGTIDWAKAKADDISFAIIRIGFRGSSTRVCTLDAKFTQNVSECERLGIPYGVYFYTTAKTVSDAREEARFVINHLKNLNITMPVYFDMEESSMASTSNRQLLANMATAFCETIAAAGYEPGVYANTNWFNNFLTDPCFDSWSKWVAQYYSVCQYEGSYDMWQCSSTAKVAGFSSNVDINMDFRTSWTQTGSWVQEAEGWKFRFDDGNYASGSLVYINGLVYTFDANNVVKVGWQKINGEWRYFSPTTGAMQRGWLNLNGSWYYLDLATGAAVTGWTTINGATYCFGSDYVLIRNGWATYGGKRYYMDKNGHVTVRAWHYDETTGAYYYLGSDGAAYTNSWLDYKGSRYYFGSDSKMVAGNWVQVDGSWYYLDNEGKLAQNSFVVTNGKLYYVDATSHPVMGWQRLTDSSGSEAWYYFDYDYAAYTNRMLNYRGAYFYFGADSKLVINGWITYAGNRYYMGAIGTPVTDTWMQDADGDWCYLGADARMAVNSWVVTDGAYYFVGADGKCVVSGWVEYRGLYYYMDGNGHPLVNTYIELNGTLYFFSTTGYCTGTWAPTA